VQLLRGAELLLERASRGVVAFPAGRRFRFSGGDLRSAVAVGRRRPVHRVPGTLWLSPLRSAPPVAPAPVLSRLTLLLLPAPGKARPWSALPSNALSVAVRSHTGWSPSSLPSAAPPGPATFVDGCGFTNPLPVNIATRVGVHALRAGAVCRALPPHQAHRDSAPAVIVVRTGGVGVHSLARARGGALSDSRAVTLVQRWGLAALGCGPAACCCRRHLPAHTLSRRSSSVPRPSGWRESDGCPATTIVRSFAGRV